MHNTPTYIHIYIHASIYIFGEKFDDFFKKGIHNLKESTFVFIPGVLSNINDQDDVFIT